MKHVRVWAKVKLDASGSSIRLPVLVIMASEKISVLEPLLNYFLSRHNERSHSWMIKLCQIVGQLIDYINANPQVLKPVDLFRGFINAQYNGTISEKGEDPSFLCWFSSNARTVNPKLRMLEEFSDWMVRKNYIPSSLNPWTAATASEQRFAWIAWYRQNQFSFLGHLGIAGKKSPELAKARDIKLRRQPLGKANAAKAFPTDFEAALFRDGFVRHGKENQSDILEKFDWRGICIAMLLMYGARRLSEPFQLWTGDVMENPTRPGEALVRIYHPVEGQAPENPKINGRRAANRQAYLQTFYPRYVPRNWAHGNYHAGFKGRSFTDQKAQYLHVHWLPSNMAESFLYAYHNYMEQRALLGIDSSRHPFAFVSHKGKHKGEPYTISSFSAAWKRAVTRIGLPHAKLYGTTPHGGRHSVGIRANRAGINRYDAREMFGHSSLESQDVYRVPTTEHVTESLDAATQRILNEEILTAGVNTTANSQINLIDVWEDSMQHNRTQMMSVLQRKNIGK
ncbi:tyrosine-type recombinase/integrase [Massilia sp. UMI-21]|nr:tyrosine-type recombinase/integrase [Massilia sp. UMI-21]